MKTPTHHSNHVELDMADVQISGSTEILPAVKHTIEPASISAAEEWRIIRKIDFQAIPILSLLYL